MFTNRVADETAEFQAGADAAHAHQVGIVLAATEVETDQGADVSRTFIRAPKYTLGGSVSGTWVTGAYMRSYFGVTPTQAAATGYPIYRPGSGFKDVCLSLNANYLLSEQWSVVTAVGSPNQMPASSFLVYSF